MTALPIQVAFQGGGARLALLLPVIDALVDLEAEGKLTVTRVAGTSAGAIAAALLAANANIPALVEFLKGLARERTSLEEAFPSLDTMGRVGRYAAVTLLIAFNRPLADDAKLRQLVTRALQASRVKPNMQVGELSRPCFLVSADLVRHESIVAAENEPVIQALMESAGLPFMFRTAAERVDGGILDNLPAEALQTPAEPQSRFGDIIAVSFDEASYTAPPRTAFQLGKRLLDSAMTSTTRSTKRVVGPSRVLELPTRVGELEVDSFSIDSFVQFILDANAYTVVKDQARRWFLTYLSETVREKDQASVAAQVEAQEHSPESLLRSQLSALRKLTSAYLEHPTMEVTETAFEVIAYGLDTTSQRRLDIMRSVDCFKTGAQPLFSFAMHLFSANASDPKTRSVKLFNSRKEPVPFVQFIVPEEGQGPTWTLVQLLEPLPPSHVVDEVYTVVQEIEALDVMKPLDEQGADYLSNTISLAIRAASVEIRLCVPTSFGPLILEQGTVEALKTLPLDPYTRATLGHKYVPGQLHRVVVEGCPGDFDSYVWRSGTCNRGEVVRVIYRRAQRG